MRLDRCNLAHPICEWIGNLSGCQVSSSSTMEDLDKAGIFISCLPWAEPTECLMRVNKDQLQDRWTWSLVEVPVSLWDVCIRSESWPASYLSHPLLLRSTVQGSAESHKEALQQLRLSLERLKTQKIERKHQEKSDFLEPLLVGAALVGFFAWLRRRLPD